MFEILHRRRSLTGNQIKILAAAIIGDAIETKGKSIEQIDRELAIGAADRSVVSVHRA